MPKICTGFPRLFKIFRDRRVGERVVRGIMRNDLVIWTHPEFETVLKYATMRCSGNSLSV